MTHELKMHGEVAIIYCHDRIVAGQTNELRDLVMSALNDKHQVILNMSDVSLMDSTGLGTLAVVCITARKRGLDVKLVAPSQYVADVLETTMLGTVFKVFPTDAAALATVAAS